MNRGSSNPFWQEIAALLMPVRPRLGYLIGILLKAGWAPQLAPTRIVPNLSHNPSHPIFESAGTLKIVH